MRATIFAAVFALAIIGAAFAAFRHIDRTQAQPVRDLSRMMSVRFVVSEALTAHYRQHDRYPSALSELPLPTLRWGDEGSSVRDVKAWTYVSEGPSFTMTWTSARGAELYGGGRTGQVYFSRAERR